MLVGFSALCVQFVKWISCLYLIIFCSCKENKYSDHSFCTAGGLYLARR